VFEEHDKVVEKTTHSKVKSFHATSLIALDGLKSRKYWQVNGNSLEK